MKTYKKNVEIEEEPTYNNSNEKEVVDANFNEILVARKVMHTTEALNDKAYKDYLFHSKCIIKCKMCDLMVDGWSCVNTISTYMVDKIGQSTL